MPGRACQGRLIVARINIGERHVPEQICKNKHSAAENQIAVRPAAARRGRARMETFSARGRVFPNQTLHHRDSRLQACVLKRQCISFAVRRANCA